MDKKIETLKRAVFEDGTNREESLHGMITSTPKWAVQTTGRSDMCKPPAQWSEEERDKFFVEHGITKPSAGSFYVKEWYFDETNSNDEKEKTNRVNSTSQLDLLAGKGKNQQS